jgi:phage terminase large subunit-like protein
LIFLSQPDENGFQYLKPFFYCPENTIEKRTKEDRVPYRYWADRGFITSTPGDVIDYNYIKDDIRRNYNDLAVKRIEFDRWNASEIMNAMMEEGFEVSTFSQAIGVISAPTKEFEKRVYEGKIKHDGNPVLEWMLSCCIIYRDANENMKVHKGQSNIRGRRVDGIVAAIMALGGSMSQPVDENRSIYANPDVDFEC